MADETTTETTETESPVPQTVETTEAKPHPLSEGGVRFDEVYRRMKDAERREGETRERLANVEGRLQAAQPQAQPPQFYTQEQLQALVDTGRITPAVMANQLAWQHRVGLKQELKQEFAQERKQSTALDEVKTYITKVPGLSDTTSRDFSRVAAAAREIADDTGMSMDDPRVQRRACREVFGPIETITDRQKTRDFSRQHADTFVETGGGGGTTEDGKPDPLKGISKEYIKHWESRGYTREQMVKEAPYVRRAPRKVAG